MEGMAVDKIAIVITGQILICPHIFKIPKKIIVIKAINGKILFTKLFNILYFDTRFKGFSFFEPSLIFILLNSHLDTCQSPLVHLASLVLKLKYDVGKPSISTISDAKPHLRYEPSIKS